MRIVAPIVEPGKLPFECRLWQNVLIQVLADLWTKDNRKNGEFRIRARALQFILTGRDFLLVCEYAGVNPERFKKQCLELLRSSPTMPPLLRVDASRAFPEVIEFPEEEF